MNSKKRKIPYTDSIFDSMDGLNCDMGVPLDQQTYYVITVDGGWTSGVPDPEENVIIRRGTKSVLFVFRSKEKAEQFCRDCPMWVERTPGNKIEIVEIDLGKFNDLARTWSHILLDPVERYPGNVIITQELLSRID